MGTMRLCGSFRRTRRHPPGSASAIVPTEIANPRVGRAGGRRKLGGDVGRWNDLRGVGAFPDQPSALVQILDP